MNQLEAATKKRVKDGIRLGEQAKLFGATKEAYNEWITGKALFPEEAKKAACAYFDLQAWEESHGFIRAECQWKRKR